ncbi:MAG TPA: hypothetical protein VEY92_06495 [Pseudoxanthomonas sp.]|nr:hypothetical protein [Pseudoxanthomonas sp.]
MYTQRSFLSSSALVAVGSGLGACRDSAHAIPATSGPDRQSDNLQAGIGANLDEQQRQSLIAVAG